MRCALLVNVALALAGERLRLRSPFARRHPRNPLLRGRHPDAFVQVAAGSVPELAELNSALVERLDNYDRKARECGRLHEAYLQSVPVSEARAAPGGDLTLLGVRRDLASATTGLARIDEAEQAEDTAEDCSARRTAGEHALAKLQHELDSTTAAKVSGAETDDLYETVLGRLRDHVDQQRESNGRVAAACEQLVTRRNEAIDRNRQQKEFLSAKLARTMTHLGAASEPALPAFDHVARCWAEARELQAAADEVRRNRGQVLQAQAAPAVSDCEVSDWIANACSATCGGGSRALYREVVSAADGGAACPALSTVEACSEQECPADCATGDWSSWSSCVEVKSRVRNVVRAGNAYGEPCGSLQQTAVCAAGPDGCTLGEWSEWSGCSRACGGGSMRATRGASPACGTVEVDRVGLCNAFECADDLACARADRPAFILDGSGSVGAARFAALQTLLADAAAKMPEAAVLLAGADVQHVSAFAAGQDAAGAARGLSFPASATTLPAALEHAIGLGARTLVVFTDGEVNSPLEMLAASQRAQAVGGRVVMVAPELAAGGAGSFASQPVHDNVLGVPMQGQPGATNLLVSMLCSELA